MYSSCSRGAEGRGSTWSMPRPVITSPPRKSVTLPSDPWDRPSGHPARTPPATPRKCRLFHIAAPVLSWPEMESDAMHVDSYEFGQIVIDGAKYDGDVVVDRGEIRKRKKGPSKPRKAEFG